MADRYHSDGQRLTPIKFQGIDQIFELHYQIFQFARCNQKAQAKTLHHCLQILEEMKGLPTRVFEKNLVQRNRSKYHLLHFRLGIMFFGYINDLKQLDIKAVKLIQKLPSETADWHSPWKPLSYIYKRRLASAMYQVYHNTLPEQLTSLLGICNTVNKYDLRRM